MSKNPDSVGKEHRPYNAPIRREQAELTRQRVMLAARQLFAARGYVATTVEAIASQASVAVPTLYASFGSKPQILAALVTQLKEEYDIPARVRQLMTDPDPRRQLTAAARVSRDFVVASWDVLEVLRAASKSDSELALLYDDVEGARLRDQQVIVQGLAERGVLKAGVDVLRASDVLWSLTAHDQYRLLVVERGWSADDFEAWLAAVLVDLLLA